MTKKQRFEEAIIRRKDKQLAGFWNELTHEFDDPYSVDMLNAQAQWMLYKTQAENNVLMIEFLEVMKGRGF